MEDMNTEIKDTINKAMIEVHIHVYFLSKNWITKYTRNLPIGDDRSNDATESSEISRPNISCVQSLKNDNDDTDPSAVSRMTINSTGVVTYSADAPAGSSILTNLVCSILCNSLK